jgi:diadenosine tetraphosphate (Ap4A) HIT family hydrolase
MPVKESDTEKCFGCKLAKEEFLEREKELPTSPPGGTVIKLDKFWIINHYGGSEGFLGWLALQPIRHVMEIGELTDDELCSLGKHFKNIDNTLQKYWKDNFPEDQIKRVYIVYFFESVFDSKSTNYHLHIHLIPRTKAMDIFLREEVEEGQTSIVAWNIYKLMTKKRKEMHSLGYSKDNDVVVRKLMEFLKKELDEFMKK